jgi:tetratricopeptide (TPR) repeat protein
MKNLFLTFMLTAISVTTILAQSGEAGLKDANRSFNTYKLDPGNNKNKLGEAAKAIEQAANDPATAGLVKTWQLRGDIYNEVATQKINARQLAASGIGIGGGDPEMIAVDHPGLLAAESYKKVLEIALKKPEKTLALKGVASLQNNLQNLAIFQYEDQDQGAAFNSFAACLEMHDILAANGQASMFDEPGKYEDQVFYVGLTGVAAGQNEAAKPYLMKLYDMQAKKPNIFELLYNIESAETSPEEAFKFLEEGRKRFPEEVSLLFAEINHYLRIGKLDALIGELKKAIELEPTNVTLYTTLGSVYDNLYQKESSAGNKDAAESYAASALVYFNQALEIEPGNFDALYSIGALYYNKAAAMTLDLNKLADDYSRAGLEKFKVKQAEVIAQFDQALPYFKQCEVSNPNDRNTLIALKEIFAKKDNLDLSNEFKARLEKLDAGENIATPYFKN